MAGSQTINMLGQSGYYFFFGWCEDRKDPMKLGRIRVRIMGLHPQDKTQLPTESLPWAQVILPVNVNDSAVTDIQEGTFVSGFFLDGEDMQVPIINGHLPGLIDPSIGHYSKTDKTIAGFSDSRKLPNITPISSGKVKEPPQTKGEYPYVHGFETESGHSIIYDDTPSKEKLQVFHKSGSYVEINSSGNIIIKAVDRYDISSGDNYELCNNKTIQINENLDITVNGNANITVNGNANETISGSKNIKASQVSISASSIKLN